MPDIKRRKEVNDFLRFNYWDDGTRTLANKLPLYRIENRLNKAKFSKLIKVSESTIERIEKKSELVSVHLYNTIGKFIR